MSQVVAVPVAGTDRRAKVGAVIGGFVALVAGLFSFGVFVQVFEEDPFTEFVAAEKVVAAAMGMPGAAAMVVALPAAIAFCIRGRGRGLVARLALGGLVLALVAYLLLFLINR